MKKEKHLVIKLDKTSFDRPMWVCIDEEYLYIHETFKGVNEQIELEYKHDKHLAG